MDKVNKLCYIKGEFMKFILCFVLSLSTAFAQKTLVLSEDNTVTLNGKVTESSVSKTLNKVYELSSNTRKDLYLILYTPGGSVMAGRKLIDGIKALPNKVHTVSIFAASMGYQIVQNLDNRYIIPSGILMSHRANVGGLSGQIPGELTQRVDFFLQLIKGLNEIAAERVGISLDEYNLLIRDEYWTVGADAVVNNHADEVVFVKCDDSLSGTYSKRVRTLFGTFDVTYSKCPIITGPLKIDTGNNKVSNKRLLEYFDFYTNIELKP